MKRSRSGPNAVTIPENRGGEAVFAEFVAMLHLLDDDTPEVRDALCRRFREWDGDVSEWLGESGIGLSHTQAALLSSWLAPGRRRRLEDEWQAPVGGSMAMGEDWDHFECLLRNVSDFLHDGVTIRPSLSDALDLLHEEAFAAGVSSPDELRVFLFGNEAFVANRAGASDPRNLDLAWVAEEGKSDALGLCLLYLMMAHRMDLEVAAVDYPGHFFCRIHENGEAYLIDCFERGRAHELASLLKRGDMGPAEKRILAGTVGLGTLLLRVLHDLGIKLEQSGRTEDAALIAKLRRML